MAKTVTHEDRKRFSFLTWPRRLALSLVALALLVWFAPTLIGVTPLRHWAAGQIFSGMNGTIHVGKLSLGWFAPVVAEGVEFRDPAGEVFLTLPRVESGHNLLRLLLDLSDLGSFHCDRPALKVVFSEKSSNLEQALAEYLKPTANSGGGLAIDLQVNNASVEVVDRDNNRTWNLEPVSGFIHLPREQAEPLKMKLDARWRDRSNNMVAELEGPTSGQGTESKGQPSSVLLKAEAFPLEFLAPLTRRLDPGLKLVGELDLALKGTWNSLTGKSASGELDATIAVRDLEMTASSLGQDRLKLKEIRFPCRASLTGTQVMIEKAELQCDCGTAVLRGKLDASCNWNELLKQPGLELSASVDLARLTALLPRTLRLREDTNLTAGEINLVLRSVAEKDIVLWTGELNTTRLEGNNQGNKIAWPEPLALTFRARVPEKGVPVIEDLRCKSSFLNAQAASVGEQWAVSASYDLGQLARQLGQFVDLGPLHLAGTGEMSAKFQGSANQVECLESRFTLRNLHWQGPGVSVKEPLIELQTAGKFQPHTGRLELANARINSEKVTINLPTLKITPAGNTAFEVQGNAEVNADLDRIRHWLPAASSSSSLPLSGKLAGTVAFQSKGTQTVCQLDVGVTDLIAGDPKSAYWREPFLALRGQGTYEAGADLLHIARLQIDGAALKCDTQGKLAKVMGTQELSLQGQLQYDLEKLDPILNLYIGTGVKFSGKGTSPLQVVGPLAPPTAGVSCLSTLQAGTSMTWKSASVYGLDCGPADAQLALAKGWLQLQPIQSTISQGTLRLHPYARLEPGPMELYLVKGKAIEHAKITPQMCAGALKYALPALAGMTEGDGDFSLDLHTARIPFADPMQADISGQFTIHQARIGAAPLIQELGLLLKSPAQAKLTKESIVPFRVVNRRVYHQNMELAFPDLTVRTSGSVGFDNTLDLVAEFPVPPKWLPGSKVGQALANQTITLPVRGTLQHPQLDRQALANASRQVLENAGKQLLQQEINNKLKKIFGPK